MTTTNETITSDQIRTLSNEAAEHGDLEQVAICDRAIAGDAEALAECAKVIANAQAQGEVKIEYYTANDITPNRCTITGVYATAAEAEGAIESDPESGLFDAVDGARADDVGKRAYHRDGCAWI